MDNRRVMNIIYPFYGKDDPDGAVNALTKEANFEWEKVIFNYSQYYLLFFS